MERSAIADNAASPFEYPFALRRKVQEARTAIDDQDAKRFLKPLKSDRIGWVTPQTLAARPKCFSLANASTNPSLSIKWGSEAQFPLYLQSVDATAAA